MKPLIVANWKMNPISWLEAKEMVLRIEEALNDSSEVVIAPPHLFLDRVSQIIKKSKLGAQDASFEARGAFTGEVSAPMLKELGVEYLILGHSERRKIFKEDKELIDKKIAIALKSGLSVILCVGEEEGEEFKEILRRELSGVNQKVIVAYEPIWAIGSGKALEPDRAEKISSFIKEEFKIERVIYGGSVTANNYQEYLKFFDGLLVGGASLKPEEFIKITQV